MLYSFLIICLVLSAFFSSLETGLLALGEVRIRKWAKHALPILSIWIEEPSRIITGILVGNNLVNICFSSMFTVLVLNYALKYEISENWIEPVSIIFSSFAILLFGEIIPKTFANTHPDKVVRSFYIPFIYFYKFITKIVDLLNSMSFFLVGPLKIQKERLVSRKELYMALNEVANLDQTAGESSRMLGRVLSLSYKTVAEVMIARKYISAVDLNWEHERILEYLLKSRYSRIPAYESNLDNLKGFIYIKDVVAAMNESDKPDFRAILRKAYISYPGRSCQIIFHEMKKHSTHCSIIMSHKRVIGLVTIEDVIEEIVGEIYDEYDFRNSTA